MAVTAPLPTLYQYYTSNGINSGLSVDQPHFTLNGRNITIYSGAMHYFRVPQEYWRDRLRKMRATGLNAVETYIPWNLHEPQIGHFDFGNGDSDMTEFLNIEKFLKTAQEEDMLAIVRPGPYICAEWEFGGFPSWLLREKDIKLRTSDRKFLDHVARYFRVLLPILAALQFTRGGPIVGFQVENEYGSTEVKKGENLFRPDKNYIQQLKNLMLENGIQELLFTSDSPAQHGDVGTLPELFQTANFARNPQKEFDHLQNYQNGKPIMAMEYWTGWFDHWTEPHQTRNNTEFRQVLEQILSYPASVNMYMFHGGTNWGFLNGANIPKDPNSYQPDTTSYDYDAPLSENGNYTEKYHITKELIEKHNEIKTKLPDPPLQIRSKKFNTINITGQLSYEKLISKLPHVFYSKEVLPMELLPFNHNSGQSYGYIIYRKNVNISSGSVLKIKGYLHDSAMVLVNGKLISSPLKSRQDLENFGYWRRKDQFMTLPEAMNATLDIIVENWGRNNFGSLDKFRQFKGLSEDVHLNEQKLEDWTIYPLEFRRSWTNSLSGWNQFIKKSNTSLYFATLEVDEPEDTFIDMTTWNMGIVTINGFVLGRYMHIGPQQTLYLPAPLLRKGTNVIVVFEHFTPSSHISFSENHIYLTQGT